MGGRRMWQFKMCRITEIHAGHDVEEGFYNLSYNAEIKLFRLSDTIETWFSLYDAVVDNTVTFPNGVCVKLAVDFDSTISLIPIRFEVSHSAQSFSIDSLVALTPQVAGFSQISVDTPNSAKCAEDEINTCLKKLERAITLLSLAKETKNLAINDHASEIKS